MYIHDTCGAAVLLLLTVFGPDTITVGFGSFSLQAISSAS